MRALCHVLENVLIYRDVSWTTTLDYRQELGVDFTVGLTIQFKPKQIHFNAELGKALT